jgi:hypothetical protein
LDDSVILVFNSEGLRFIFPNISGFLSRAMRVHVLRVAIIISIPAFSLWGYPPQPDNFQLGMVLKASRDYCRRLELAAVDFVCIEEIAEVIDRSMDKQLPARSFQPPPNPPGRYGDYSRPSNLDNSFSTRSAVPSRLENAMTCDFQFIREAGKIKESRMLLEMNGKKAGSKDAAPKTQAFQYSDILLAPVRLLDERIEEFYFFRLLGKETIGETESWVLEVVPRMAGVSAYLGAKLWLKIEDSSIIRIEWDPSTFGNYETILARAESYKAMPAVRSYTEFAVEKNGVRFPSVDFTEEAYRLTTGKLFIRASTNIVYRAYKFFVVETKTVIK